MLSGPPADHSGATPLQDRPANHPSYLSARDRNRTDAYTDQITPASTNFQVESFAQRARGLSSGPEEAGPLLCAFNVVEGCGVKFRS